MLLIFSNKTIRKQAELAYFWNTLDLNDNLLEDPRPKFKGQYRLSPITNKDETYYPHWKRLIFRCFVTIPVLTSNILLVALCMLLIFRFQSWIDHNVKAGNLPHLMSLTQFSPKILLAIMTTIFSDLYKKISRWLNDKENYREQSEYDKQMITKLFAQLLAIFVIKQFWRNIKEALVPYFVANTKLSVLIKLSKKERDRYEDKKELNKKLKQILDEWECSQDKTETKLLNTQNSETYDYSTQAVDKTLTDHSFEELHRKPSLATFETLTLSQAEIECSQPKFPDLYEDYLEMIMQFGYIIFFSSKFPLAAFFSLLNNIVEIRTDAFKICMIYQRPFTQRVKDIGHWQNVLELMIIAAVIVNCTLCCVKGIFRRILPMPFAAEIFILVLIEHVLILICQLIRSSVEKTPYWVRVEKAKLEYRRRDALKKLECDNLRFKDEEQQECRTTSNVINN
ncbi:unnamed protein product [Didymodactylos carnosus]|uniref:Anoctamin n=1 Tax=Didymodactylos carnosus TaxID=1234261 RepID=A0A814A1G6_9BILA|nr:unnamed protein product [Didymodactylos carnosus]CAF0975749.1 unnamed protein product [Didymodactylos carnosus]CAF3688007.1 unnamed protein product [Didymodactylos carnosus]CAF3746523.1 unnamed protein product [Didymodactylos carnosus]